MVVSKKGILFLCTGNSCRSQMAEGFAKKMLPKNMEIFSAGLEPKGVHPMAIKVMQEIGIDISHQKSKNISEIPIDEIDLEKKDDKNQYSLLDECEGMCGN